MNKVVASPEMKSMQILQGLALTPAQLQVVEKLIRNKDKVDSEVQQPDKAVTPVAMTKAYSGAASMPFSLLD